MIRLETGEANLKVVAKANPTWPHYATGGGQSASVDEACNRRRTNEQHPPGRIDGRGTAIDTCVFETFPAYFGLFRIPTLAGRVFNEGDGEDRPRVVVLSEWAARRFFAGANPLGRRIECRT